MNQSRSKLWWAFWSGVVLVIAALGWASYTVHSLEERNAESRAMNQRQELIRLALWRMDSRLAPMIALEAARPIEDYRSAIKDSSSVSDHFPGVPEDHRRTGADLGSYNLGFFEINEQTGSTEGSDTRAQEIAMSTQNPRVYQDTDPASSVEESDDFSRVNAAQPEFDALTSNVVPSSIEPEPQADYAARQHIANLAQQNRALKRASENEVDADQGQRWSKSDSADESFGLRASSVADESSDQSLADKNGMIEQGNLIGAIEPRWIVEPSGSQQLVLLRTINQPSGPVVQGVWLDWETMSSELIESIDDLLPRSVLEPILEERAARGDQAYRLATVPVSFIPGSMNVTAVDRLSPVKFAMLITWVAVVGAMIAVGLVLRTVLNLSARRGRFVGAVTHELRTPLTTFRLYSQMLADGMVTDETVRKDYLNTLKRESDRLTGIVENVLEYARISRQRSGKDKPKGEQTLSVGELMARIVPPMSRLGEQSGMDLIVSDSTSGNAERTVTLDPHAVERIVMNLMDNACKYAGREGEQDDDQDHRVHLDVSVSGDALLLVVADHGPGVPGRDRRKIFGEFVRGSSGTMRDRSGLGLGLALSRGLALEMGGDLSLVRKRGHGAEFELRVPLDSEELIEN
jgi:signal transduction histidine kinase